MITSRKIFLTRMHLFNYNLRLLIFINIPTKLYVHCLFSSKFELCSSVFPFVTNFLTGLVFSPCFLVKPKVHYLLHSYTQHSRQWIFMHIILFLLTLVKAQTVKSGVMGVDILLLERSKSRPLSWDCLFLVLGLCLV